MDDLKKKVKSDNITRLTKTAVIIGYAEKFMFMDRSVHFKNIIADILQITFLNHPSEIRNLYQYVKVPGKNIKQKHEYIGMLKTNIESLGKINIEDSKKISKSLAGIYKIL